MALQTVVYPQDPFGYGYKEIFYDEFDLFGEDKTFTGILQSNMENGLRGNWENSSSSSVVMQNAREYWDPNSSPEAGAGERSPVPVAATSGGRRKRRRTKSCKNKEELENQRMTHIAVERNRRKQMNEYLAVIRSLMPPSYAQRGDQASIIGGAINFVKELEQLLQTLEAKKRGTNQKPKNSPLFADFFSFPQYSTRLTAAESCQPASADIEVSVVESHANLKILSKRRPRQLLKMVAGLQCLRFSVLHLYVTTVDQMVLYSLSVKIEEGCQLTTVDEIADAVNHLLGRIEEEAAVS
ncbi:hypothetical protein NMG60_11031385 [Bertholletia excelsa]